MTSSTGSGLSDAGARLRPEARPLPFDALDCHQQDGFRRMIDQIADAVSTVHGQGQDAAGRLRRSAPDPRRSGPFLDLTRSNRSMLISGDRGTGKTTLLLTLAAALGQVDTPLDVTAGLDQGRIATIDGLRRRLVWLETLDMEPLAEGTNLLGAVLARVEEALGTLLPDVPDSPAARSLLHPGESFHDAMRELRELQTSAALAFDGNLRARAANLDPDSFAVESRRAERERLNMSQRFATALAALSAVVEGLTRLEAPVFVLPVDDLDLNLTDCLPLLQMLRTVYSPHLITLIAGSEILLETVLELKFRGDFVRIAGGAANELGLGRETRELAANALRKYLPAGQRVSLELTDPDWALGYRPAPGKPSLREILGHVRLADDTATVRMSRSFAPPIDPDWYKQRDFPTERYEDGPGVPVVTPVPDALAPGRTPRLLRELVADYTWTRALRLSMRGVADLHQRLSDHRMTGTGRRRTAGRPPGYTVPGINAAADLAQDLLEKLNRVVAWPPSEHVNLIARFVGLPVRRVLQGVTLVQQVRVSWTAEQHRLDSADLELLAACTDLIGPELVAGIDMPSPRSTAFSALQLHGRPAPGAIEWPWVEHTTVWAYDRAFRWLRHAERLWDGEKDAAFGAWVAVMTLQLLDPEANPKSTYDDPPVPMPATWPDLVELLRSASHPLGVAPTVDAWLVAAALLCTPEMGFQQGFALADVLRPLARERFSLLRSTRLPTVMPDDLANLARDWPQMPPPAPPSSPARPRRKTPRQAPGSGDRVEGDPRA